MADTRESILQTALRLFARDGYSAVSVRAIAEALGLGRSALYKHYKNKRAIFDSIVERMQQMDQARAQAYEMPEGTYGEMADAYRRTSIASVLAYSQAQFCYWTEEEFPSCFRKMLTLEQYRDAEMARLYQQYLASGPVGYMEDLFRGMLGQPVRARELALSFYAPIFLLYNLYDAARDKSGIHAMLRAHLERFALQWEAQR